MYITIQYFLFLLVVAFMKNLSQSNTLSSFKFLYMRQTTTISADISLAGQNASKSLDKSLLPVAAFYHQD